jgi:periplasmic protein TonB
MEHSSHKDANQKLAFAISVCFHALLLLGTYYLPLKQWTGSSSGYSIALNPSWSRQEKASANITSTPPTPHQIAREQPKAEDKQAEKRIQTKRAKEQIPEDVALEPQDTPGKNATTEQIEPTAQDPSETSTAIGQEDTVVETIDERGLYKVHQGKTTGALLELAGWMWDAAPQPQDNTDESGKIVFQIIIDEFGEVIAIKTIEKTISPLVEQIYKEALIKLTFSKTTDNLVYAPTSTGKVTFILQVK